MIVALGIAAIVGFALPHALRLRRTPPATAIVIWTSALTLRALAVVLGAAWLLVFFPETHLFAVVTHWCWHHLAPAALSGHDVGHLTAVAPALLGIVSLISVAFASIRLGRTLRRVLRSSRGGPEGSVIVGGMGIDLAVVGFVRPRVVVSAGALLELDDDELTAALEHERAHIARRHRYWMLYGQICAAIARVIPGTRAAVAELMFQLERDADRWALARPIQRRALAAVLRKASRGPEPSRGVVLALGGSRIEERLEEILDDRQAKPARRSLLLRAVAAVLVTLVFGVAAAVPSALAAGIEHGHEAHQAVDC